ncbi:unnamed protein product, partial [Laminaria digitata]
RSGHSGTEASDRTQAAGRSRRAPIAMAGRGRGGRFGRDGRGLGRRSRGGNSGSEACTCEANTPLLNELRKLDGECVSKGRQNLRHGIKRAMKSVKLYPLPITTEAEACALEGVGPFIARRMLLGLATSAAVNGEADSRRGGAGGPGGPGGSTRAPARRANNEENIGPSSLSSSSSGSSRGGSKTKRDDVHPRTKLQDNSSSTNSDPLRDNDATTLPPRTAYYSGRHLNANNSERPLSLASYVSALRGEEGGGRTPDVTPKRPTSRARTEVSGDIGGGVSSKAPRFFSGRWKAMLIVDNREHEFMSMQSALLQKGVPCETRQLPLGDMLWVARREDDPASEVLLGYIVERKTASDLASSIVDGRYDEQKRRLKLSGLRRRIYLVEGNLSHQNQLPPATLRTALASSQACGGLAIVRCASLTDSVAFLARTHHHIASLLSEACRSGGCEEGEGGRGCGGRSGALLRPAMTYGEYVQDCAKRAKSTTVRRMLGAMVRQVPGCSAARAQALVRRFDSPLGFLLTLERAAEAE